MKMGFGLSLVGQGGGTPAPFAVALTGLTNGEAIIGDHATISYTTNPVSATETVKWSNSANPADAATYGTGANPTDYTAGDEGRLYLHVTDTVDGETATVTRSALIRYARGTAPAVADGQAWTVDDTSVNIDGSASGANLTFTYAITGLPDGVSINAGTGAITGTPTAVDSGTATITATDQYGLDYTDSFTWANTLRTQATAAGGLGPFSFTQDAAITSQDLSADFTANGNTLTFTVSPALPAGLSLASNGILSGTPTATAASATYTVTGQDEYGRDTDSSFALEVVEDGLDADAAAYIAAVETADGQSLEAGVQTAINDFVVGCKADGIWADINSACILAGARTLTGALVPLKGTAPTNNNFVSADYDRKTGLVGNASTKELDTNFAADSLAVSDHHLAVYATTVAGASGTQVYIGETTGVSVLLYRSGSDLIGRSANANTNGSTRSETATGLIGVSRDNSATWELRADAGSEVSSKGGAADSIGANNIFTHSRGGNLFADCRLSFYSFGSATNLADLEGRLEALETALDGAIA